ncbi:MAG: hypothetical protein KAI33_09705 [Elusimicrobiales bacterium]|nr:hypothetical protein [Elusimicrobiales bacterium]
MQKKNDTEIGLKKIAITVQLAVFMRRLFFIIAWVPLIAIIKCLSVIGFVLACVMIVIVWLRDSLEELLESFLIYNLFYGKNLFQIIREWINARTKSETQ